MKRYLAEFRLNIDLFYMGLPLEYRMKTIYFFDISYFLSISEGLGSRLPPPPHHHQQQYDHDDHDRPDHQSLPGNVFPLVSIGSSLLSTGGISREVPGGRFILSTTNFSLICYLCHQRFTLWRGSTQDPVANPFLLLRF